MSDNNQKNMIQEEAKDDPALINLVYLDNISRRTGSLVKSQQLMHTSIDDKLSRLLDAHISSISIGIENQNTLSKLLKSQATIDMQLSKLVDATILQIETNIETQTILNKILEQNTISTNELLAEADEGGYRQITDTVISSEFYFVDTEEAPSHPVRSFILVNMGPNTIWLGWNLGEVGPSIEDVVKGADSRFFPVACGKHFTSPGNNREVIMNIHMLASDTIIDPKKPKQSAFEMIMTW